MVNVDFFGDLSIGIFPTAMICLDSIFLPHDWVRAKIQGSFIIKKFDSKIRKAEKSKEKGKFPKKPELKDSSSKRKLIVLFFVLFFALQIYLPLRHLHYGGKTAWDESGHLWSWRMKLRSKSCNLRIYADGKRVSLKPFWTQKQYIKYSCFPESIVQFARYLRENHFKDHPNVNITAISFGSLNYRTEQPFIVANKDLSRLDPWAYNWKDVVTPIFDLHECELQQFPWKWDPNNLFKKEGWSWLFEELTDEDLSCSEFHEETTEEQMEPQ